MNILENLGLILGIATVCILVVFSVYMIYYYVSQDYKYYKEVYKYGKIEGKVINKEKEIFLGARGMIPPYQYYLEIEKELDGQSLTRRVYISEKEYSNFNIGDYIKKEKHSAIIKIN